MSYQQCLNVFLRTFDELVEEWKEEQANGGKKGRTPRRNQQDTPPADSSSKTPSGKSTSRKSRKKRGKK